MDGNQRGKNLRKHTHDLLQCVLVLLGCALDSFLRDTIDAGDGNKVIVEIADRIADDDLELARLGESALADFSASILATSALAGSLRTNRIRDTQCDTAAMFSLPPTYSRSSFASS